MIESLVQFIADPRNAFWQQTLTTLRLSLVPLAAAVLIGAPLGLIVAPYELATFLAANTSGLVRAIPSIAVLAIAIPYLGIGFAPSVVALTVLGIPPVLLNTVAGLRGVDPSAVDAGRGVGMTAWQLLGRIQLPLMLPVLVAGVRTAAVQIIATVPLASLIGGGGYGDYITGGLNDESHGTELLVGALSIAVLAVVVELSLAGLQRVLTPSGALALQNGMTGEVIAAEGTSERLTI